jgi:hypothetical protein
MESSDVEIIYVDVKEMCLGGCDNVRCFGF